MVYKIYLMCVVTTLLNMIFHLIVVNQLVYFLPKYLSLLNVPKVFLYNNVVKFKNNVKNLGVFLNNNLKDDDDDICLQVRYLYGKSYQLKTTFSKCFHTIKNILFNYHCTSFYASHLWSKYLCSSLNHFRVAYNDSFRLIHWLKRNVFYGLCV